MTHDTLQIFYIPDENLQALTVKLDTLAKRANKLKTFAIGYRIVGQELRAVNYLDKSIDSQGELHTKRVVYHQVEVFGSIPVLNGWQFLASIDHIASNEGNIVSCVPGMCSESELVTYRNAPPICEHCHMNRQRNTTYILRNVLTHVHKQVGRTCLVDFLGTENPLDVASSLELLSELCETCVSSEEEKEYSQGASRNFIPLDEYLQHVSASIKSDGWISSKKAQEEYTLTSTANNAYMSYLHVKPESTYTISELDKQKVIDALVWIRFTTDTVSDYMYNLVTVCKGSVLSIKHKGIAASLFVAYDRAMNVVYEQRQETQASIYVGEVKDKITVTVKVLRETPISGQYGTSYLYSMLDESNGNRFKWFSSSPILEHDINATITLLGTVKAHETYNNVKSTCLTRCKKVS